MGLGVCELRGVRYYELLQAWTKPPNWEYCACFVEAVEAMVGARGGVAYFPALIPLFGAGAFDDGSACLAAYLHSLEY